jgi:hypothetical protein
MPAPDGVSRAVHFPHDRKQYPTRHNLCQTILKQVLGRARAQSVIHLGSSFYLPENKAAWRMPKRNSLVGLNANAAG